MDNKKRHHYVPKVYLKPFCDDGGKIFVYRKDDPDKPFHQSPDSVGFHKYYYSQPLPEGGRNDNLLEDFFSKIEGKWPSLVDRLRKKDPFRDHDSLETLHSFIALQRVRVPAARDGFEKMLSEVVRAKMRAMEKDGMLSPRPPTFKSINIYDHLEIAIDPHMSIHAMAQSVPAMIEVFNAICLGVLHNKTDIPFLTSDNPVIWFDPSVPENKMRPYVWSPPGPLAFIFPVTPDCVIYGSSHMREAFASQGFVYGDLPDKNCVKKINHQICRFAYETVFAREEGHEALIIKHAGVSPVMQTCHSLEAGTLRCSYVFGPRERKPKWPSKSRVADT